MIRTQTEIANQRRWVGIAALSVFIAYSLIVVAYGYYSMLEIFAKIGWPFAHLIAAFVILVCFIPGFVVWKVLRPHTKFAAVYGLLMAELFCAAPFLLK